MTRVQLENVNAKHKSGAKLVDVSMLIDDGEYVAVLGPTGSGPSELLKVIAGQPSLKHCLHPVHLSLSIKVRGFLCFFLLWT